jgi:hypothetical protein
MQKEIARFAVVDLPAAAFKVKLPASSNSKIPCNRDYQDEKNHATAT